MTASKPPFTIDKRFLSKDTNRVLFLKAHLKYFSHLIIATCPYVVSVFIDISWPTEVSHRLRQKPVNQASKH